MFPHEKWFDFSTIAFKIRPFWGNLEMDRNKLEAELRRDEGEKLKSYKDSLGYWTIGIGTLIDPAKGANPAPFGKDLRNGGTITKEQSSQLFQAELDHKIEELDRRLPWWRKLDAVRQRIIVNMAYQLGVSGLLGFKNTLAMVQAGNYAGAAKGMMNSLWAKQTPNRAKRLAVMMETGGV